MRPRLAVTMGDPAGVGPELCLRVATDGSLAARASIVIFGSAAVLQRAAAAVGLPLPETVCGTTHWPGLSGLPEEPCVLDLGGIEANSVVPGEVSRLTGRASYRYVEAAIQAAIAGDVAAVVTGPIHKEALHTAGIPYTGHTEILAAQTGCDRYCMMLTSKDITCSLVTTHVGLHEVAGRITTDRVLEVIELSHDAIRRMRGRAGKLVVCGLNPHAGEHGLFGSGEEEAFIVPAVEMARARGITIEGPLPADTAFVATRRAETDCYVCMYHDQGLIPVKALAFETAVNVTLGLPIVRTSVDHGTALDIAWQGRADASSMRHAIELALQLI